MAAEAQAELVFIPGPVMGHLPSMIEVAKKLAAQGQDRISVTFLIMRFPSEDDEIESLIQSLKPNSLSTLGHYFGRAHGAVRFLELPPLDKPPDVDGEYFLRDYMDAYKPIIKEILLKLSHGRQYLDNSPSQERPRTQLAGIVVDLLWTNMIDVANELGVNSYIFFAASAALIRLMFHFEAFGLPDTTTFPSSMYSGSTTQVPSGDVASTSVVEVQGFRNPVPLDVWPDMIPILGIARSFLKTKGILINTFPELEPHVIRSLTAERYINSSAVVLPPIYPVGPLINQQKDDAIDHLDQKKGVIMSWLDSQPTRSVVFLCFGSRGTFNAVQIKEISVALEHTRHRFLWSLRKKADHNNNEGNPIRPLKEYDDFEQVLPEGFLERTAGIGKVIGWAPQASVLGHRAVGAFVSHCGWNSILEGVWNGVPILTWPIFFFDQKINAFSLVREMGLAVEIRLDYRHDYRRGANMVVAAEEIEKGLRKVMDMEGEEGKRLRERVEEVGKAGRKALLLDTAGGSSNDSMARFVDDVLRNIMS